MTSFTEPQYDEDLVNKGYVDSLVENVEENLDAIDYNKNFGSQPTPPYHINDTYMDGTDIYICTTERLIGNFNSADWSRASDYTDDTLASSMNKVFVNTPTPPYKIGDLWTTGPNGVLYRCKTSKILGESYNIADWENATSYDDTKTTVQNGLVTTGTVQVVNGGTVAAGVTGQTSGDTAIRFWAGSSFDNRGSAPFRVTQAGAINAISGVVGGCVIDAYGMYSGSGDVVAGIGLYGVRHAFWAGKNANESGSAPFRVGHDGALYATQGEISGGIIASGINASNITVGELNAGLITTGNLNADRISGGSISASSITSNSSINITRNGGNSYLRMGIDTQHPDVSGLRIGSGGANFGAKGINYAYDSYSGLTGFTYSSAPLLQVDEIHRASNGDILIRQDNTGGTLTISRRSGAYIQLGSNVNVQGGYTAIQNITISGSTITGGNGGYMYANSNCLLAPVNTNYYAYIRSVSPGNKIAVSSGGPSSRNVKENIKSLNKKYNKIYKEIQKMNLYSYNYKYKGIKDYKKDYGFIIDELEELPIISKIIKNYDCQGYLDGKKFIRKTDGDENKIKAPKFKYKEWDRDSYIKTMFIMIKALQMKIDMLEKRLEKTEKRIIKLEGGK